MPRDYDLPDDYDDHAPGAGVLPHRGAMILVLGILGMMLGCFITGIMAIVMGRRDLALMKSGRMDPEGKAMTQVGYILGIVSTIISLVAIFGYAALVVLWLGLR
jgi:MFS family permease